MSCSYLTHSLYRSSDYSWSGSQDIMKKTPPALPPRPAKGLQISQCPKLDHVLTNSYDLMGSDPLTCLSVRCMRISPSGATDLEISQGSWTALGSEDSYNWEKFPFISSTPLDFSGKRISPYKLCGPSPSGRQPSQVVVLTYQGVGMGLTYMGLTPCHCRDYKTSRKTGNLGIDTGERENCDLLLSVEGHLTTRPVAPLYNFWENNSDSNNWSLIILEGN